MAQTRKARRSTSRERPGQVQSLGRALAILDRLAASEAGLTLTDLAQSVGLAPSTAHRLLTTLEQNRYVRFEAEGGIWAVGVQAFVVGNTFLASRNLATAARPFMRRLMEESGETVNLAVEDEGCAVYVAQVECREMMRAFNRPGHRVPLHATGVGKALLAAIDDASVDRLLRRHGLPVVTERSIATPQALHAVRAETRARGYAVDDEEQAVGLRCVAAAIFDENGEPIAALSISAPTARAGDERLASLGAKVRETADAITAALGGQVPAATA